MDELDKLLTDLHKIKSPKTKAPAPVKRSTVNFRELDDLMSQFVDVLSDTSMNKSPSVDVPPEKKATTTSKSNTTPTNFIKFEDLKFNKLIGKGNFGAVHRGVYNGLDVAIKELFETDDTNIEKYYQREIEMLSASRHPNIVQFIGVAKNPQGKIHIVTEFCDGEGDLRHLNTTEDMPWQKRVDIALGVAKAVAYLHGKGIIHRDLKSENILLTKDGIPKVCDFGFARPMEQDSKKDMTMCGTDWTMAPEILLCMDYSELVDVFSFGMILAELISRAVPSGKIFKRVIPGFGLNPEEIKTRANQGCPQELIDLCIKSTTDTPSQRPAFSDIITSLTHILENLYREELAELKKNAPIVDESEIVEEVVEEKKVERENPFGKDDETTSTENIEGVFVRRKLVQTGVCDKFVYAVENTRTHDVLLAIEVDGENAKILPVGQVSSLNSKQLEGVVPMGSQSIFATVEPIDLKKSLSFSAKMQVERIDMEIRCTELQGVHLTTQIKHGRITEIVFDVYNKRKDDVEVELEVLGGPLLEGSSRVPISAFVAKGDKKIIGHVRSEASISTNWRWKGVVKYPDQASSLQGITLTRKHLGARTFEFDISSTRQAPVSVQVTFSGELAENITLQNNPTTVTVKPGELVSIGSYDLLPNTKVDWKWSEL